MLKMQTFGEYLSTCAIDLPLRHTPVQFTNTRLSLGMSAVRNEQHRPSYGDQVVFESQGGGSACVIGSPEQGGIDLFCAKQRTHPWPQTEGGEFLVKTGLHSRI